MIVELIANVFEEGRTSHASSPFKKHVFIETCLSGGRLRSVSLSVFYKEFLSPYTIFNFQ
jgi:hypothetical protein